MNISLGQKLLNEVDHFEDPVLSFIERFRKQPSVVTIFASYKHIAFSFRHVSFNEITKEIKRLTVKKARHDTDIPTKVNRGNSEIFSLTSTVG